MSGKRKGKTASPHNQSFGSSKKMEKKSGFHKDLGDVTLADYANSSVLSGKGRLTKAKTSFNVVNEVKKLNIQDKAWYEKADELVSVNSFSGEFDLVEEAGDEEEAYVSKKPGRRKKTLSESMARDHSGGNTYPIDIWHILSIYIKPEDIAIFSAICKGSWCVVNTPIFWINLYNRHYKKVSNLPARLQPESMVRHHGLKACVIRSLFYMYPPLATRVDKPSMSSPYNLTSRQCITVWQEGHSNKWSLNFKLRRKDHQQNPNGGKKTNLIDVLSDIFANSEDGSTILQVINAERMMPPREVMGLTLHSINISLDMTMPHMNIQLVFGSGRICNGKLDPTGTVPLSLKSVSQVRALDWWHPQYPHSANSIICYQED